MSMLDRHASYQSVATFRELSAATQSEAAGPHSTPKQPHATYLVQYVPFAALSEGW